jgi:hypothetical protein
MVRRIQNKAKQLLKAARLAIVYGMSVTKFSETQGVSKQLAERLYQDVRDEESKKRKEN